MTRSLISILILSLILYVGCSNSTVDGSGTGTGNPVILGQVISDDDTAFANASVKLRPINYYSDDSLKFANNSSLFKIRDLSTDSSGKFTIDSVDIGEYIIEVSGKNQKSVIYNCEITEDTDTLILDYSPVLQNDTIIGSSKVYGGDESNKNIYVEGLERCIAATDGEFVLIVPTGIYNLKAVTEKNETGLLKSINSFNNDVQINILASNPVSSNYICDTLIVRAILDSNNITRSAVYHAFKEYAGDDFVFQIDIEDPEFYTLPSIIGGMSNLRELEIQFSKLSVLPVEIGNLTNIRELELNDNQLTTLPIEITNLSPSDELDLRGNNFEDLPQEIINWGNKYNALW